MFCSILRFYSLDVKCLSPGCDNQVVWGPGQMWPGGQNSPWEYREMRAGKISIHDISVLLQSSKRKRSWVHAALQAERKWVMPWSVEAYPGVSPPYGFEVDLWRQKSDRRWPQFPFRFLGILNLVKCQWTSFCPLCILLTERSGHICSVLYFGWKPKPAFGNTRS